MEMQQVPIYFQELESVLYRHHTKNLLTDARSSRQYLVEILHQRRGEGFWYSRT